MHAFEGPRSIWIKLRELRRSKQIAGAWIDYPHDATRPRQQPCGYQVNSCPSLSYGIGNNANTLCSTYGFERIETEAECDWGRQIALREVRIFQNFPELTKQAQTSVR